MPKITFNDNLLSTVIPQMNENFDDGIKQPSYEINDTTLTIIAGKAGSVVKTKELTNLILEKMLALEYNTDPIEIPVENVESNPINVDAIHNEIYKEAQDASYTVEPYEIKAAANGLDFDISVDEAKALITGDKETYDIPLKILYPNVTNDQIGIEAFPHELASYSTNYSSSGSNRANNVALAASKIDGTVLMPGETFSYNGTVGKRTVQAGFKEAGAYANGQVVTEVGGGICQVSSTLYNTVLRANLEVVERTNHMFDVGYVPIGTDATVSWGGPDFKFKNNRNYAIKIVASTSNRNVYISIYGLKEDDDQDVEILLYRTETAGYRTTYTTDSSLKKGQTKVVQSGSNGATSATYKILKKDGVEVDRVLVSRDTYSAHNQIIARGN